MSRSGASQNRVRDRRITGEPHLVHRRFVSASKVNILRPRVRTFRTRGLGQPIPARASPARTDHPCQGLRVGRTRSRCGLFRKLNLKLEQKIDGQFSHSGSFCLRSLRVRRLVLLNIRVASGCTSEIIGVRPKTCRALSEYRIELISSWINAC